MIQNKGFSIFFISCCCLIALVSSSTLNLNALKKNFDSVKPYSDLSNAFYSIKGLQLLGEAVSPQSHAVSFLNKKENISKLNYLNIELKGTLQFF